MCNKGLARKEGTSSPAFVAQFLQFCEDTLMLTVLEKLQLLTDAEYTAAYGV